MEVVFGERGNPYDDGVQGGGGSVLQGHLRVTEKRRSWRARGWPAEAQVQGREHPAVRKLGRSIRDTVALASGRRKGQGSRNHRAQSGRGLECQV